MAPNLTFDVTTFSATMGRQKKFTPDAKGTYKDVPIAVIGMTSRNMAEYDPESMVQAHTSGSSRFHLALTEGHAEGEWGHPFINEDDERKILRRMGYIDRARVSHFFSRCYTKPTADNQYHVVYSDINPFGPFGEYLIQSFENNLRNTAFSLRSLCKILGRTPMGAIQKYVTQLITYDAVDLPGYKEASTWFGGSSTESLCTTDCSIALNLEQEVQRQSIGHILAIESITHQQILDIFECDKVEIYGKSSTLLAQSGCLTTPEGNRSIFHTIHK
jgi:hypothetical protein